MYKVTDLAGSLSASPGDAVSPRRRRGAREQPVSDRKGPSDKVVLVAGPFDDQKGKPFAFDEAKGSVDFLRAHVALFHVEKRRQSFVANHGNQTGDERAGVPTPLKCRVRADGADFAPAGKMHPLTRHRRKPAFDVNPKIGAQDVGPWPEWSGMGEGDQRKHFRNVCV